MQFLPPAETWVIFRDTDRVHLTMNELLTSFTMPPLTLAYVFVVLWPGAIALISLVFKLAVRLLPFLEALLRN